LSFLSIRPTIFGSSTVANKTSN